MALATYANLKTSVADWLKRADLTTLIPDFIALAEERIARDLRLRKQVVNAELLTVSGVQTVTLPTAFLEIENVGVSSTSPARALHVITPEYMDEKYPNAYLTGVPTVYALLGDTIQLGPTPDAVYTISLDYYKKFDAFVADADTNWLLTNNPSVYLFAAMTEACIYTVDDERATLFDSRYKASVADVQGADDIAIRSGSTMRVRTV